MKQRVKEMEAEAAKLREMQSLAEREMNMVEEGLSFWMRLDLLDFVWLRPSLHLLD
jgi:hypothetical protein